MIEWGDEGKRTRIQVRKLAYTYRVGNWKTEKGTKLLSKEEETLADGLLAEHIQLLLRQLAPEGRVDFGLTSDGPSSRLKSIIDVSMSDPNREADPIRALEAFTQEMAVWVEWILRQVVARIFLEWGRLPGELGDVVPGVSKLKEFEANRLRIKAELAMEGNRGHVQQRRAGAKGGRKGKSGSRPRASREGVDGSGGH